MSEHKIRRILALSALAVMLGAVVSPAIAGAHTPSATATCERLDVTLEFYPADTTVTVTVASQVVETTTFAEHFIGTYPLDPSVATSWSVEVDSPDDPDGEHGWSVLLAGETEPCVTPTTVPETTSTTVPETPPTTVRTYECDGTGDGINEHDYNDPTDWICAAERPADPPVQVSAAGPVHAETLPVTGVSQRVIDAGLALFALGAAVLGLSLFGRKEQEA